jgi:hypothetical protein
VKQVLHIFAKDARRFWPEILISLAITVAYVRIYPHTWLAAESVALGEAGNAFQRQVDKLAGTLLVLVPVTWWLLITRVVHAESLVGDRQFWTTRPYDWRKLLAAKLLFIVVFVYLPFTCAQLVLLAEGGFQPFAYLRNLLFLLLLISGVLVAPLLAVAVVTRNFARMTMTLLGILVCVVGLAFAASLDDSASTTTPYSDRYTIPLILLMCGSAIVVQYARRKAWVSRSLLLSIPVIAALGWLFAFVLTDWSSVDSAYPQTHGLVDAPVQLSYSSDWKQKVSVQGGTKEGRVEIQVPIQVEGVAAGHAVLLENLKVSINGSKGEHWSSSWEGLYSRRFLPGVYGSWVTFKMKRVDYERFKQAPVILKLTFALTEVRAGTVTRMAFSGHGFSVPEFGICPADAIQLKRSVRGMLQCRSAFHGPELMYVSAMESAQPCAETQGATLDELNKSGAGVAVGEWVGSLNNDPADFGLTPVWETPVSLSTEDYSQKHFLCPGTPLTFTRYDVARRMRIDVNIPNLKLPGEVSDPVAIFSEQ